MRDLRDATRSVQLASQSYRSNRFVRLLVEAQHCAAHLVFGKEGSRLRIIEPNGIVTRHSTNVLAIQDPNVAQAMRFIRDHAFQGIKVPDVVNAVAISRSALEKRFMAVVGYTIGTAIRRAQVESSRRLVTDTDRPLKQIALDTGFKSVQHMTTVFGRHFGHTPGKLRHGST